MNQRIFIIDDEETLLNVTSDLLKTHNYQVTTSSNPVEGLKRIQETPPDLLLLDILMPELDGIEICKRIRSHPPTQNLPIIIVSSHGSETDIVTGLTVGADDYIVKPVRKRELLARVKSVLKRQGKEFHSQVISAGPLKLDLGTYRATLNGEPLTLSPKEFSLLSFFMKREGQALTRPTLAENVWGAQHLPTSHTIKSHIDTLRQKLGPVRHWIQTLQGVGYRFESEP
jgi:DNA-binding response OmpR family regulator